MTDPVRSVVILSVGSGWEGGGEGWLRMDVCGAGQTGMLAGV